MSIDSSVFKSTATARHAPVPGRRGDYNLQGIAEEEVSVSPHPPFLSIRLTMTYAFTGRISNKNRGSRLMVIE
eukprot:scaffold107138_cov38-Cyclotella_meneghiniana.AAC.3